MKKLDLHEIRTEFLNFFESKGHKVDESFSLVPHNDKSLLLIGAGMAPLKKYFTGELIPVNRRMATCQKCIRTGDIENVGKTARHATFFEMLGNFSFGDYFKKEAISWAWEFLTEVMEFDKERLWATIYEKDDEAFDIWKNEIQLPENKIVRLGKKDNFWELEVGPSGPDSEIFYDRGEKYGCGDPNCKPGCDCDRYIEIWNLVFTQFDKDEKGNYNPLPNPNIDTGMGLERITCVVEDVNTIYDIKAMRDIISSIEKISGIKYGEDSQKDISIRVIIDHVRAMTFMVSDGIIPSNESRGYVLRRIIRRAARHGRLLGIKDEFLAEISEVVINNWKNAYSNLETNKIEILKVITSEENKFKDTLGQGLQILDEYIDDMKKNGIIELTGDKVFKLYDTYGFPSDLTTDILEEKGFTTDIQGFEKCMEVQRSKARDARTNTDIGWENSKINESIFEGKVTKFDGYQLENENTKVILILKENEAVESLTTGEEGIVILQETPFYAESGGQLGDTGFISSDGLKVEVLDTKKQNERFMHIVKVLEGKLTLNDEVFAQINTSRRNAMRKNHTATHLLHRALKDVLGEHVNQAGSIVTPQRLRFDFTHFDSISNEELNKIEKIVNNKIFEQIATKTIETTLDKADEYGAIGLFEDKYKENIRIVAVGDYSKELCGGTHVNNTSEIGIFKIISESSIAAGVRRIEAVTGEGVYNLILEHEETLKEIEDTLKINRSGLVQKAKSLTEELKSLEKELNKLKNKFAGSIADEIINSKQEIKGINVINFKVSDMDIAGLRTLGDEIKSKVNDVVIILGSIFDDKPVFVGMASKSTVEKGIHVGNIIKKVASVAGGGGGGRPDMAQAGGKDSSKIDEALKVSISTIEEQLK